MTTKQVMAILLTLVLSLSGVVGTTPAVALLAPAAEGRFGQPVATVDRDANGNAISIDASVQRVPRLPFIELGEAHFISGFVGSSLR